jgi:hypothetical protein
MVKDRHARLSAAHAAGLVDEHPSVAWNRDSKALRACRDSMPGNVASSKEIEDLDHDGAQDDPPHTAGTPKVQRPGTPTMDSLIPGYRRLGGGGGEWTPDREDDGVTLKTTGRVR